MFCLFVVFPPLKPNMQYGFYIWISTRCCFFKSNGQNYVPLWSQSYSTWIILTMLLVCPACGSGGAALYFSICKKKQEECLSQSMMYISRYLACPPTLCCCVSFLQMSHFSSLFVLFLLYYHKSKYQTQFQKSYSLPSSSRTYESQIYRLLM